MQQTAAYKQRGGDQRHGQLERDIAQKLGQICARMMLYAQVGFALQPRAQKIGQQRQIDDIRAQLDTCGSAEKADMLKELLTLSNELARLKRAVH